MRFFAAAQMNDKSIEVLAPRLPSGRFPVFPAGA
jgi:hypothetical protein